MDRSAGKVLAVFLLLFFVCGCVSENEYEDEEGYTSGSETQIANPASVYCVELGYTIKEEQCVFPDGESCEQWDFFTGDCGTEFSFCENNGGKIIIKSGEDCTFSQTCTYCQLPSGKLCDEMEYLRGECS
ncbi:DUF333 domain-containing protein [bacterium]|nr:DUF333 domain-containing protein [bacterium]